MDYIFRVTAYSENGNSKVIIRNRHTNIILIEKNDKVIYKDGEILTTENPSLIRIKNYNIDDFIEFVENVTISDLNIVNKAIIMNERIAEIGLKNKLGLAIGYIQDKNFVLAESYPQLITSAACDARMAGYPSPVMSLSGSGNHGLVATLPIIAIGNKRHIREDKIIKAVTLSALITLYIKSFTGILTPVCGCGVAAGVGTSAGITYLLDGNIKQIKGAIKNMVGGISCIICDGAKPGCSFKLFISVSAAIEAAKLALDNNFINSTEGIVDKTAEKTIENLGSIATLGMENTDNEILDIMAKKS